MLYAGGLLFGRLAKLCVQVLRFCEAAEGLVTEEAADAIALYLDLLVKAPQEFVSHVTSKPV